jgi:hypothetical protein
MIRPLFFLLHQVFFKKEIKQCIVWSCPDFGHCGDRKIKTTYFDPKHLKNHDKFIYSLKKAEIPSQKPKSTRTKNQPELIFIFSWTLKVKKTPNMNFSLQKKPFDTNIVCFSGLNWCQRHVFFLPPEFDGICLLS